MAAAATTTLETTHLIRDCCLCLHVQRTARALARRFDEALRPIGLTNGQFSLMVSLNRPEPPGMKAVASLLAMDRTTLTAALKPLRRRGLVRIMADPADRLAAVACRQFAVDALEVSLDSVDGNVHGAGELGRSHHARDMPQHLPLALVSGSITGMGAGCGGLPGAGS